MREYIISIAGAALLSGVAKILSPAGWDKYVRIISGLVIISVIAAPVGNIAKINIFSNFSIENSEIDEGIQIRTIKDELQKRVENDIEERVRNEFFEEAEAEAVIGVNENNEITGVLEIIVYTKADEQGLKKRLCEIYGTPFEEVIISEP